MTTTRRLALVWVGLLGLTFGSFAVGIEQGATYADLAAIAIMALALLKVRLIGLHFMDVRVAPVALRVVFEGYVLAVFVALVVLDIVIRP